MMRRAAKPMASRRRQLVMRMTLVCLATGASANQDALARETSPAAGGGWSYAGAEGPESWGSLDPAWRTCAAGELQSPIDISSAQRVAYVPLMFRYRSQLLEAENTGRGVRLISPPGSALVIGGQALDLHEFSFKVPGEHRFQGMTADGEIHLIHRDPQGNEVVVAVPLRVSDRENLILERILEYLPTRPGERVRHRQVGINPIFLLPADRSYFRYTGSQVTPPCTEPVIWLVFRDALDVSVGQIQRIAQATGPNARPTQPLNGRPVYALFRN